MFPVSDIYVKRNEINILNTYYLGADLANMVNAAAIYAASEGDTSVTTRHLEFAKDKILMGKYFVDVSCGWPYNVFLVYYTVRQ